MICPEVGTSSRLSDLKNVDLPQPEGPIMAITSPLVIVVLMSLSTTWSPNVFFKIFYFKNYISVVHCFLISFQVSLQVMKESQQVQDI